LSWYLVAPLLVESGDWAGYGKHRQRMLARFGTTNDPPSAQRVAKGALLLPLSGADLVTAAALAETGLRVGKEYPIGPFHFTKGLAEYRQGHFDMAADWAKRALAKPGVYVRDAQAYAVLAMSHQQLKQIGEAREALAQAKQIVETKLPGADSNDLGSSFHDWFIAHILLREAKALIDGQPAVEQRDKSPATTGAP
jgi:tetratricopeptide (TPR) repeat protein